ncbi:MAG: 3-oxoacyl-ACP reductase FabG [Candidatus Sumerlaeota bacterium]|nr:3-oxoacyl-ACP reductase FabG [Candidatus Sumerlaeota bacterium]
MAFDFTGQTVIVTGGTRGIGRGVAEAFLKSGACVIATYTSNAAAAEEFKSANAAFAERLECRQFDVADYAAVESFFRSLEGQYERVEIVVNNSGIRKDAVIGMMPEADWRRVLDVNLTGAFNMCKFAVQTMSGQRYGRIVNIISPSGKHGFAGQANYAASKAGLEALTRSISKEIARRNVTVNCVSPGFIGTDLIKDLPEDLVKQYKDSVPMKRFGTIEEVAHCVLFLASREASYVTGATLEVTGGL